MWHASGMIGAVEAASAIRFRIDAMYDRGKALRVQPDSGVCVYIGNAVSYYRPNECGKLS